MFQRTFDVAAEQSIVTDARPINAEQDDALSNAYSDQEQDFEAVSLDETMNSVFRAVHTLPPGRFAAVKRGQIEWLKKRNVTSSIGEECKLMEAPIEALQTLVW